MSALYLSALDRVTRQSLQALRIALPVGSPVDGDTSVVVEVYALGVGVAVKGESRNLFGGEGSFELEANGKVFVFNPLTAGKAHGLVSAVQSDIATVRKSIKAIDQKDLSKVGIHSAPSPKTAILCLPQGYGKTLLAQRLAQKLGCHAVVDEWTLDQPALAGALHLTSVEAAA